MTMNLVWWRFCALLIVCCPTTAESAYADVETDRRTLPSIGIIMFIQCPQNLPKEPGGRIQYVDPAGPAGMAGLRVYDVIQAIGQKDTIGCTEVPAAFHDSAVIGKCLEVKVSRRGKTIVVPCIRPVGIELSQAKTFYNAVYRLSPTVDLKGDVSSPGLFVLQPGKTLAEVMKEASVTKSTGTICAVKLPLEQGEEFQCRQENAASWPALEHGASYVLQVKAVSEDANFARSLAGSRSSVELRSTLVFREGSPYGWSIVEIDQKTRLYRSGLRRDDIVRCSGSGLCWPVTMVNVDPGETLEVDRGGDQIEMRLVP
jgi:hypothetical protein